MKPSLKKPGDFIVAEGRRHPLVKLKLRLQIGGNVKTTTSRWELLIADQTTWVNHYGWPIRNRE
jgi:hypothetical protein